ncbi:MULTISPECIES: hypothetical protein [Chitinophaga]|uniref:Uncharacterized protein n=1 Tax=Chitinophaga pollutisoli TaxID=3133966 RepID=A0ABZ2YNE2_9BACT|nr:hypothetical protein [Chitinophaga rhizosphaerae]
MKILQNIIRGHDEVPLAPERQNGRRWLKTLASYLRRSEQLFTVRQKQTMLLCFTLVAGTCFLHLAITGVISPRNSHRPPIRQERLQHLQAPLPQALSLDSIQNKNLLP